MKPISAVSIFIICAVLFSAVPCFAADFLYLVLQWPGSYCNGNKQGCCYATTGKPARDFAVAGLWPGSLDATIPKFCNSLSHFNITKTSNLTKSLQVNWPPLACPSSDGQKLWELEWQNHGTCSGLNPKQFFEAAVTLKKKVNLLKILTGAGIEPNGTFYDMASVVEESIRRAVGYMPGLWCNQDKSGNTQLYQVVLCCDVKGTRIIDCPGIPQSIGKCAPSIKFPPF